MAMSVFLPSLWALGEGGQAPWAWLQKLAHRAVPGHLPWHLGKARGTRRGGGSAGWLSTGDNGPLWPTGEGEVPGSL